MSSSRSFWIQLADQLAAPVLDAASTGQLKARMPVEVSSRGEVSYRARFSHLEAVARLLSGIAPWLELGHESEARHRAKQARSAITAICNPDSPDYLNWSEKGQPLVDAAFLCLAILRAPRALWDESDGRTRDNLLVALDQTRDTLPPRNNWLLFSATVEAFFCFAGHRWDAMRVDYALQQHEAWFKGDATYGDGPHFVWDYYNSYVIHPMICEVVRVCADDSRWSQWPKSSVERLRRYAQVQENLISPEGTFPMLGRSSAYRCGALHALAMAALWDELSPQTPPAAVREALTAVLRRQMTVPGTFDEQGWLQIGFCGHDREIGEGYISTGSLYLCATALLPLGLAPDAPFWSAPPAPWTQKRVWAACAD